LADQSAAADREALVGRIDHRRLFAGGAQEADARLVGHRRDKLGGLVWVAGVEHRAAVDRAHHCEVLERHLRGAVLAN
jgi:hypothetical protein